MHAYEYKVVPAPSKGTKAKGVRTAEARFSNSIEITLNQLAAEGWEYQRSELLPSDERVGLTGSTTNWRNVLIFRRALTAPEPVAEPVAAPSQEQIVPPAILTPTATPEPSATPDPAEETPPAQEIDTPTTTATAGDPQAPAEATPVPGPGATRMLKDDGVEEVSPVMGLTAALRQRAAQQNPDKR